MPIYKFHPLTAVALRKIPAGTVAAESAAIGADRCEPLLLGLDGLLRYAEAYRARMGGPLAEDGFLGPHWLDAAKGLRGLLNGDGAVAMELDRSTDSKDNGACEAVFWAALEAAGYTEADI